MNEQRAAALLDISNVTKRFGPNTVLRDVSLSIAAGEIRAVCGENGAGKSTLIKIVSGVHALDEGEIAIEGSLARIDSPADAQREGIAVVSQELSLAPNLSVLDNIWLGHARTPFFHRRRDLRRRAEAALREVGLDDVAIDAQVQDLGVGQRQLVEIARLLARDARIMILDEPTATLSDVEIERVFRALRLLKAKGRAILYITHRLGEVFEICDSVTVLRNGECVGTEKIGAIDRPRLISMMLGREMDELYPTGEAARHDAALVVRDLRAPNTLFGFDFTAEAGAVTCLAGQIGSGATEALRALAGLDPYASGRVSIRGAPYRLRSVHRARAENVRFVSEDRAGDGIFLRLTVAENLLARRLREHGRFGFLRAGAMRATARALAELTKVDASRLNAPAGELSGGNQQKLAFGRLFDEGPPGVLLLNEPTRGVDVGARAEIYRLVKRFCAAGWCVVLASSDLEEALGMGDRIVTVYRGRVVATYPRGGIDMHRLLGDITHNRAAA